MEKNSFIKKEKEFVRLLGPNERKIDELKESNELIDILHYSVLMWKKGDETYIKKLEETGYRKNEVFYKVAQAISE
jgi:hypothetical protein